MWSLTPTQGLGGDSHRGSFCPFRDLRNKSSGKKARSFPQLSCQRAGKPWTWDGEKQLSPGKSWEHLHFSRNTLQTSGFCVGSLTSRAGAIEQTAWLCTCVFPALSTQGNRGTSWQNPAAACVRACIRVRMHACVEIFVKRSGTGPFPSTCSPSCS